MDSFSITIAGFAFDIRCCFSSTREYFRAYLTEQPPVHCITATEADRIYEQVMLDEEAEQEKLRRRKFTDPFLERAAIQRAVAAWLLDRNVLLLHGSTVAVDGRAYLFTARTGTGKSTHTRLWREQLGGVMVNDDRTFLTITPKGVIAHGSPWSGKHGLDTNLSVPLAGICLLERGTENRIVSIDALEALPGLLPQAFLPNDSGAVQVQQLTEQLAARVPLWKMQCTKDPEAALLAHRVMSQQERVPTC